MHRPTRPIRRSAATLLVCALLPALGSCVPRPQIVSPADGSVVDTSAPIAIEIELGDLLAGGGSFRVTLLSGIDTDAPELVEIPATVVGTRATHALDPESLGEGRNTLFVSADADDDGQAENVVSASFSAEPDLAGIPPERCDPLDPSFCLYPFPNDHFTRVDPATDTGRRVDFDPASVPVNTQGSSVDPTEWNRNDGFSTGAAIQAFVPGLALTTASADPDEPPIPMPGHVPEWDVGRYLAADASFVILDTVTGERVPLWAELEQSLLPPEDRTVLLRPARALANGRRYVVALRNLRDASGALLEPERAFRLYRDAVPTYVPAIEARRPHMEQIFDELAGAGIPREDLYLAWDFTTISKRNVSERMVHMRDDAFAWLGDAAPAFSVTNVEERSESDPVRLIVNGTFQVPLYLTNGGATGGPEAKTRLYCEDDQGEQRLCRDDELPMRAGDYTADFRCVIPRSASQDGGDPVTPARASLYGHGLLGSESETGASHVRAMAGAHNFVFCGTKWIGMASDDFDGGTVGFILTDFSRFPTLPDRMHQGFLNFLFLGRLMIHPDGLNSHPAFQAGAGNVGVVDTSALFYDGNSQGAIAGGALAAFGQDFTRAVLGVPGMNYSTLLLRSVDFLPFLALAGGTYSDPRDMFLSIHLAQMLWDRAEVNGHANHLTGDTYPDTPAKKILLHVAFGDFQVANVSAEVEARTLGAHIHRPAFDPAAFTDQNPNGEPRPFWQSDDPYWNLPALAGSPPDPPVPGAEDATYAYDGSAIVIWDSGNLQPPQSNTVPVGNNPELSQCALQHGNGNAPNPARRGDPHECPRRQPAAQLQKSEFLKVGGRVVDVCGGEVCLATEP